MNSHFGGKVWQIALFLCLAVAFGFIAGHSRRSVPSATGSISSASETAQTPRRPESPGKVNARQAQKAAPADLTNLNGKEFVAEFASLEAAARSGNLDAARLLYGRLRSCVGFQASSDEEIRRREDADYQRQFEISRRIQNEFPNRPVNPMISEASLKQAYERALKEDFDQRDLCTSLKPQQVGRYLDWVQFALERQDRETVLDATIPTRISSSGIDRVRNAERLMEIAEIERSDLNNLIATGDLAALERAAYAYESDSNLLLSRDPELAYMYAYALSLAGGYRNDLSQMTAIMQSLASGQHSYPPLTSQQIDAARARGSALFQSCCASGHQ